MAATNSIKVTKSFTYRGVTRQFSNRYHFLGGTPSDAAHWTTFANAVVNGEKPIYDATVTIVRVDGYLAGSDVPVFTKTYTTLGTGAFGTFSTPGDVAMLIRYATAARTPKNHPVYLFNYYHGAYLNASSTPDVLYAAQSSALDSYAGTWVGAGWSDGVNSYTRAGPNGAAATGHQVEPYLTHRDLPR